MPGSGLMPSTTSTSAPSAAALHRATTRSISVWSSPVARKASATSRPIGSGGASCAPSFMSATERSSPRVAMGFTKATRTRWRSSARTSPRQAVVSPTWRPAGATRRMWAMIFPGGEVGGRQGSGGGVLLGAAHDLGGVDRDHELLVGGDDRRHRARRPRDAPAERLAVERGRVRVEREPREPEQLDDPGAHLDGVLADAAREDERVDAAERHDHAGGGLGHGVAELVDRERRALVTVL